MAKPRKIVCDFDGTITDSDVTDAILHRFAEPGWLDIERQWLDGFISAKMCMTRQVALIRADKRQLDECIDAIPITAGFIEFARFCLAHNLPLQVVSDGIDYAINRIMARCGMPDIEVAANHLLFNDTHYSLSFPHARNGCQAGVCKCAVASVATNDIIMIGDSHSDVCLAGKAAVVFARRDRPLEQHCRRHRIAHIPFNDFHTVLHGVQQLIA